MMYNKQYRLNEFVNPLDGRSLVIDTSKGLSLGSLPGLESFSRAANAILPLIDGLVTSPGQARKLATRTQEDGALLIRADWTNAFRPKDFVLPPQSINYIPLLDPASGLDLGATALVAYCLLGYEEHIEMRCVENIVQLALSGISCGLPLIVDVAPLGPRVAIYNKAIELGVSYALEGGADGFVIPWPGYESFKIIKTMTGTLPVWIKPSTLNKSSKELTTALELGAVGCWLDERVFAKPKSALVIQTFHKYVHTFAQKNL